MPQLLQVLPFCRRRLGEVGQRLCFELLAPIAQLADPNPKCPRYLCLGVLAQSHLAQSFELELTAVSSVLSAWHDRKSSDSKYCSFSRVDQTCATLPSGSREQRTSTRKRSYKQRAKQPLVSSGCQADVSRGPRGADCVAPFPWYVGNLRRLRQATVPCAEPAGTRIRDRTMRGRAGWTTWRAAT